LKICNLNGAVAGAKLFLTKYGDAYMGTSHKSMSESIKIYAKVMFICFEMYNE
jgi:hypothetical protein